MAAITHSVMRVMPPSTHPATIPSDHRRGHEEYGNSSSFGQLNHSHYSSKGPNAVDHIVKPDIVAPGNQVVSLLNQHATLALNNPQNIRFNC